MALPRPQALLGLAAGVCLAWATVEARHIGRGPRPAVDPCAVAGTTDPTAVEASFAPLLSAAGDGPKETALLALRDRAARGPHPGYASFLLGEAAYREGALGAAIVHYRKAVELEPSVGDRRAAFDARRILRQRLEAIRTGPWAQDPPAEIRDLYFLQRRLAGGCE